MIRVYEGNTSEKIEVTSNDLLFSDTGWFATLFVLGPNKESLIAGGIVMDLTGAVFSTQFTEAQTLAFGPGKYLIAIKITNDTLTPAFRREEWNNLEVMVNVNKNN